MGMTKEYLEMHDILDSLRFHLWGDDHRYGIGRRDGHGIGIGEAVMFGNLFERANEVLAKVDRKLAHEDSRR